MLEAVDTDIGRLLEGIEPGKRARTMVFVVSDNGTEGDVVQAPHDPGHGKPSGYELAIRAPLIVAGPLVERPLPDGGQVCTRLIEDVDLWRTLAEITGANPESAFQRAGLTAPYPVLDSQSFLPLLRDPGGPGANPWAFTELFAPCGPYEDAMCLRVHLRTITDGEYKYMRWVQKHPNAPLCELPHYVSELYHLATDPEETDNLLLRALTPHEQAVYDYLRNEMDVLSSTSGHRKRR
jgi:arylsulfatase A-like enzyme